MRSRFRHSEQRSRYTGMLPDRVIVFDGICNLCSRSARFVMQRDARAVFYFTPLQSATGTRLLRERGIGPLDVRTFLLIKAGKPHLRSDAVLEIPGELDGGWKLLRMLRIVPRPLRDALYDWVARNRYRWFGANSYCMVPDERIRARFLE